MHRTVRFILAGWTGLALTVSLMSASQAEDASALAFLQRVYKPYETGHPGFVHTESNASRYFVKPLARLIAKDSGGGTAIGDLDFNPFTCSQDWEPTKIALEESTSGVPDKVEIVASFGEGDGKVAVRHKLTKTKAGWRIADIQWVKGCPTDSKSLVALVIPKKNGR